MKISRIGRLGGKQEKWVEVAAEMKAEADGRDSERGGLGSGAGGGVVEGPWGRGEVQRVVSCRPLPLRVCHHGVKAVMYSPYPPWQE